MRNPLMGAGERVIVYQEKKGNNASRVNHYNE
jgi:hypothetical protein